MTAAVLEHLGLLAEAPGGVERLRAVLVDLAVRGVLTAAAPKGTTAASKSPHNGKAELHPLPDGWRWSTIGDECELENGDRSSNYPNKSCLVPEGIPFINAGHLNDRRIDLSGMTFISRERFEQLRSGKVRNGDVLYCLRGSLGKNALVEDIAEGAIASSLVIVRPGSSLIPGFLLAYFDTTFVAGQISKYDNGTAQPNLAAGSLRRFELPVPPRAEQHRIVAKVDELMALCDRLEARQQDAEAAHARLVQSLLDSLTQARDAEEFLACWQRVEEQFGTLFVSEDSVVALRQAVIDFATSGRFKSGNLGECWSVGTLEELVTASGSGWSPSCEPRQRSDGEWGVLKVSAVSWGTFLPDENKALPSSLTARPEFEVRAGDFLISRANTAELVARSVFVEATPPRLMLSDKIVRLRLSESCEPRFVQLANSSTAARRYYAEVAGGTSSSMKNVTRVQILALPIKYPSLAEQRRIVAKVTELLVLCDQLKARIAAARAKHAQLAEALVAQAVAD